MRVEEFLDTDGNPGASRVRPGGTPEETVVAIGRAWRRVCTRIPPTFAVGTALHESQYTLNERDTEDSGKVTAGIFQLTAGGTRTDVFGDAHLTGAPEKSYYNLDDACWIFAVVCTRNMNALMKACDPPITDDAVFLARGGAAYLTIAHNQGRGKALATIQKYGLQWYGPGGYDERNRDVLELWPDGSTKFDGARVCLYGNDAETGGPQWTQSAADAVYADEAPTGFSVAAALAPDASAEAMWRLGLLGLALLLLAYVALDYAPKKWSL